MTRIAQSRWRKRPIRETYLGLYDGPHATPKPSEEGPVFLGIGNITDDGHLDLTDVRHIAEEDFGDWTRRVLPQSGDIVFTYEATLNRYAIIPNGFRGCLGRRLALIRPNPAVVNARYLHYYFFSREWRHLIARNTLAGATVDRIPIGKFPQFEVSVPPLHEQNAIVEILGAYDDLVSNNTRRIEILEEMMRAIYREWFVELRYPGSEAAQGEGHPTPQLPNGWHRCSLADLAQDQREQVDPNDVEPTTPYVGLEHIPRRSLALAEWGRASDVQSTKLRFRKGDILFGKIRPYFHKVAVAPLDGVCSSDAIVISAKHVEWYPLALACVSSDEFVAHATQTSNGTKMPRANWDVLLKYPVLVPPKPLLERFNCFVNDALALVQNLVLRNRSVRATRDLLLPKLFSGEIDVSRLDTLSEEPAAAIA